jgi:hypothetical protein
MRALGSRLAEGPEREAPRTWSSLSASPKSAARRSTASPSSRALVPPAGLDGQAPKDADVHHAEIVLRAFGLSHEDAAAVPRRPLPT